MPSELIQNFAVAVTIGLVGWWWPGSFGSLQYRLDATLTGFEGQRKSPVKGDFLTL